MRVRHDAFNDRQGLSHLLVDQIILFDPEKNHLFETSSFLYCFFPELAVISERLQEQLKREQN